MQFKGILPIGAALVGVASVHAQIAFDGNYTQDFDVMGSSGTVLPEGWSAVRGAGSGVLGAPLTPAVTAGTATGGGVYNVGLSGDSDRALGSLASSSTAPVFGVQFANDTGSLVDSVSVWGVMEQWRTGSSATALESLVFEYSLNAVGVYDDGANWLALAPLDLTEALTFSTSAGAVNGNAQAQQREVSAALTGLDWQPGRQLTFRWSDTDVAGSDGLYALDNFRLQSAVAPVPEPCGLGTFGLGLAVLAAVRRWRHREQAA